MYSTVHVCVYMYYVVTVVHPLPSPALRPSCTASCLLLVVQ